MNASSMDARMRWPLPSAGIALGVDWSGGTLAGRKIWAAQVRFTGSGAEVVTLERPFLERPRRADVVRDFGPWLARQKVAVAGLDFCFSLPVAQLEQLGLLDAALQSPAALGRALAAGYASPDAFRLAAGAEQKRDTDRTARAPFAATNLRMFRQTFVGITALGGVDAAFPPWSLPVEGQTAVVEVLPAQVARTLGVRSPYKGAGTASARRAMLERLTDDLGLRMAGTHDAAAVADDEGDAIDAVLAALAAGSAHAQGYATDFTPPEGAIFGTG
jgi:hypothetical protein